MTIPTRQTYYLLRIPHRHQFRLSLPRQTQLSYSISLIITILSLMLISPTARADNFAEVKGYWQCREEGVRSTLEFASREQLIYNGQAASYQLGPGFIAVQEDGGIVNYFFTREGNFLVILSPDGSVTQCQKAKKPKRAASQQKTAQGQASANRATSHDPNWPPPYARPPGAGSMSTIPARRRYCTNLPAAGIM